MYEREKFFFFSEIAKEGVRVADERSALFDHLVHS
jgi:hypothetical protein